MFYFCIKKKQNRKAKYVSNMPIFNFLNVKKSHKGDFFSSFFYYFFGTIFAHFFTKKKTKKGGSL